MENEREDEIEDMSTSPPSLGSMQFAGSNGFGHSMEFMSQAYLPNIYTEIDIKIEDSNFNQDPPLPIYLKVETNSSTLQLNQDLLSSYITRNYFCKKYFKCESKSYVSRDDKVI